MFSNVEWPWVRSYSELPCVVTWFRVLLNFCVALVAFIWQVSLGCWLFLVAECLLGDFKLWIALGAFIEWVTLSSMFSWVLSNWFWDALGTITWRADLYAVNTIMSEFFGCWIISYVRPLSIWIGLRFRCFKLSVALRALFLREQFFLAALDAEFHR